MYRILQLELQSRIQSLLGAKYGIELASLNVELPPNTGLGEMASPVAFELAKRLKKAPRAIAAELQVDLANMPGIASVEVAGAGYLNFKFDRASYLRKMAADKHSDVGGSGFRLVEHTSINPNKAAHVGHLRNAILGDTFQRLLRRDDYKSGYEVGVQNYIDNTGVQVADVVVGLTHLEGKSLGDVRSLLALLVENNERVDYYCWDLYARVSQWYEADPAQSIERKKIRLDTLHALEAGNNDIAEIAELVATAVLRRHLETMQRLGIEYDFLPRESEILHLQFWETARQLMVEKGVLYLETEGKNKGCWVMRRPGNETVADGSDSADSGPDLDAKILIRSNGTVTYVGKDIAYHLWKFGLLGKDFGYAKFREYPTHTCWTSTMQGEDPHPSFGHADAIYNVIDSRQDDPQANVVQALRGMGYTSEADRYTHLNYAMVALTPRCAEGLGYTISDEDKGRAYIEVSGRKGFGVKADDLIDRLIAATRAEVDSRSPDLPAEERTRIASVIAVGALRYFMLRFTRNTVIAFDYQDALSFEGETGPYVQYAAVRAANIFRKAETTADVALSAVASLDLATLLVEEGGEGGHASGIWELWLTASRITVVLEQAIATAEPAYLSKYVFLLAQQFNNFYHRHHILTESNPARKTLLLATAAVARREMTRALGWLGIEVPSAM